MIVLRRGSRNPSTSLAAGLLIVVIGAAWLTTTLRAGARSAHIQQGARLSAVIDARRFVAPCHHLTCHQTEYDVRYDAGGVVYRSTVVADGWRRDHPVGSLLAIVYDPRAPGRAEVLGHAPSRALPLLGASIALLGGGLIVVTWLYVVLRDRRAATG
jgi:hypothetical protein